MEWSEYDQLLYKFNVTNNEFYFVSSADLTNLVGFSSVYRITEADAQAISQTGSFSNFRGTVWSPCLAIDFDSNEAGLAARERLTQLGLAFEMYHTGNRGCHFLIPRPHAPSHVLPQIDKEWVQDQFPKADHSIYNHLGMFRLNNTKHDETGLKKKLIETVEGLPLYLSEAPKQKPVYKEGPTVAEGSIFADNYIMTMTVPHENGHRHNSLVNLAVAMKKRGEQESFIGRWLENVNQLFSEPVPQEEIDKIVNFLPGVV